MLTHQHAVGSCMEAHPNCAVQLRIEIAGRAERLCAGDGTSTNARTSPDESMGASPTKRKRRFFR